MLEPTEFSSADFIPPTAFGPLVGWVFCVGVLGLGAGSLIVFFFLRARSLVRAQEREHALLHDGAEKPLTIGSARVVKGRVEVDGADDVAVGVEITQVVRNHTSKGNRWHTWEEAYRRVRSKPFYLVRGDGQTVYVEPGESALVVDSLETKYPTDMPIGRVRWADVRREEIFYAYGDLVEGLHPRAQEGYRGGPGWMLRRPPSGRMLLATEAIRDRYKGRVSFLRRAGLFLAVTFCALHAVFTAPFVAASLFGTHTTAEVTSSGQYMTRTKGNTTTHYWITVRADDGFTLKEYVERDLYDVLANAKARGPVTVPLLRVGSWEGACFVGDQPYVYGAWVFFGTVGLVITLLVMRFTYTTSFAWYDRKKVNEHGGPGHWDKTGPTAPVAT
jgi:hypothetical protein